MAPGRHVHAASAVADSALRARPVPVVGCHRQPWTDSRSASWRPPRPRDRSRPATGRFQRQPGFERRSAKANRFAAPDTRQGRSPRSDARPAAPSLPLVAVKCRCGWSAVGSPMWRALVTACCASAAFDSSTTVWLRARQRGQYVIASQEALGATVSPQRGHRRTNTPSAPYAPPSVMPSLTISAARYGADVAVPMGSVPHPRLPAGVRWRGGVRKRAVELRRRNLDPQ